MLVGFAAFKDHCSFFPGANPIATHKDELKAYEIQGDYPLPDCSPYQPRS